MERARLRISLAGPSPLDETFKQLPFKQSDLSSVSSLLSSISGTSVSVSSNGKTVRGKVLGVETGAIADGAKFYQLTVLDQDEKIQTIKLGEDTSFTVDDAEMKSKILALQRPSNEVKVMAHVVFGLQSVISRTRIPV